MTPRYLATLTVSCVLAAAAGGYLAIRESARPAAVQLVSTPAPVETLTDRDQVASSAPVPLPPIESGVAEPTAPVDPRKTAVVKPTAPVTRQLLSAPAPAPAQARAESPRKVTTSRQLQVASASAAGVGSLSVGGAVSPVGSAAGRGGSVEEPTAPTAPAAVPFPGTPDRSAEHEPAADVPVVGGVASDATPREVATGLAAQEELLELTIPRDSVVGIQFQTTVSSETASVEDAVEARVTRDVRAGGRVVIPAGTRMIGTVTVADRGGRFKERARIGVRFHTLVLADGTRVGAPTDTIHREGSSPANESAAKVGGAAVGGAILGAILGGGRGAAIGGTLGAAGGTAAVMAGDRNAAVLAAGATVTVRLQSAVRVVVPDR